ncbi:hydrolase TatD [Thiomicrorhabdus immobilis]|uniref:Hydrolase TatD n=1 Tax=Thiomicrorhabdus immobilis TaxID=2791037 RepID=A0ABM7MB80_9GAMM|nr:TatD family hydrolase [Thiomicrorhabdus immobilis]BCN92590.1 hydrolase TatD [Thiomicrorhabdus immobilis]
MFDTHCHLQSLFHGSHSSLPQTSTLSSFNLAYLDNPNNHFLTVSTSVDDWSISMALSKQYKHILAALGLHPWFVNSESISTLEALERLVISEAISAIGEIGLDYGHGYKHNMECQLAAFGSQLQMADKFKLPTSLHIVKAHNDALALLKRYQVKGVVHGLGTSIDMAQNYIDLGLKIGVNGVSVRKNAARYHALIKYFGLEHLVLETDFPNVTLPGQEFPRLDDIQVVANTIAGILNITVSEVISKTDFNAHQLFYPRHDE